MQFVLDNIRYDDELGQAKAKTFLAENPDPGVRERPEPLFNRAMESGQCLEFTRSDESPCGLSLMFPYDPGNFDPVFHEIGAMRIVDGGYRLQVFVAFWHLIQLFIEDPDNEGETFAVVSSGTASEHNLTHHVGMTPWQPPALLRHLRREQGATFVPDKPVLLATTSTTKQAFHTIAGLHIRDNLFRTPKGDGTVEIRMRWFDPEILKEGP